MERDPQGTAGPIITGFGAGGFRVDGTDVAALLLTPERADRWTPPPLAELAEDDLRPLIDFAPEFILLGTGPTLTRPPAALVRALAVRDLGIEPMDSRAAARAWGILRAEGRRVAAALYPL